MKIKIIFSLLFVLLLFSTTFGQNDNEKIHYSDTILTDNGYRLAIFKDSLVIYEEYILDFGYYYEIKNIYSRKLLNTYFSIEGIKIE